MTPIVLLVDNCFEVTTMTFDILGQIIVFGRDSLPLVLVGNLWFHGLALLFVLIIGFAFA